MKEFNQLINTNYNENLLSLETQNSSNELLQSNPFNINTENIGESFQFLEAVPDESLKDENQYNKDTLSNIFSNISFQEVSSIKTKTKKDPKEKSRIVLNELEEGDKKIFEIAKVKKTRKRQHKTNDFIKLGKVQKENSDDKEMIPQKEQNKMLGKKGNSN